MTYKERMLAAIKGEQADVIPFAPRMDLWYAAHQAAGTLPDPYGDCSMDSICRAEGWGLYKVTSDYQYIQESLEAKALACLGLFVPHATVYRIEFSSDIDIDIRSEGDTVRAAFHTPAGTVSAEMAHTEQLKREGVTYPWVSERLIKTFEDWKIVASLFESIKLVPYVDGYLEWVADTGDDGLVASPACDASSPMHHIQKFLFDPTDFYIYYKEQPGQIEAFAASVAHFYNQILEVTAESPADVITWGGNYDHTITYPPYFEKDILPWLKKADAAYRPKGKLLLSHCDGENYGLMDLIKHSGIDAAESVCPYPMTRLRLHEYYAGWADKITIIGGIPGNLLLTDHTSESDFTAYMDYLFKAVAPGRRFFAGITDAVPVAADWNRLRRIHELVETKGRLPLKARTFSPVFADPSDEPSDELSEVSKTGLSSEFDIVCQAIFSGNSKDIKTHIDALLQRDISAQDILQHGMIAAMDTIGAGFSAGKVFIPEMLMAAQTMEIGVGVLKDKLAAGPGQAEATGGKILLGTVFGDLHDIGKNLVGIMLRGVGFEVIDLGINIAAQTFIHQVKVLKPDILALSALLTTTLPQMPRIIEALVEAGLRTTVKVIIGGAPVTYHFADRIGSDGYADNAGDAASLAKRLLAEP
jgi:methanogenic corrinoid protein MtbC1